MNKKFISFILSVALILSLFSALVSAADTDTLTVDVPINVSIADATGIDLNIRLDPNFVESAKIVNMADCISNATYAENQDGVKFKVGIASIQPITCEGTLFYLRLTLNSQPPVDSELCKLLQIKVNEKIVWQADNCIILSGVKDGGVYDTDVTPSFNEGAATLNGETFVGGTTITENGAYNLQITDLNGKTREISFTVAKVIIGDVNGDYAVNNRDLSALMQYINGWKVSIIFKASDVTGDGVINNKDYALLMRYINGWNVNFN